jgi:hypothetical protein
MTLSNAFISLNDIINNFLISYTGPGKLIPDAKRTEVMFHAKRCLQEFAYETLKSQMEDTTTLTSSSIISLPTDIVANIAVLRSETSPNTTQTPTVLMKEVSSAPTTGVDTYFVHNVNKTIVFSADMVGYKITHKYLSNALTTDEAAAIPKLAEEALYSCMVYAILANREGTDGNLLQRLLIEKIDRLEKSKSRLVFTNFF